MHAENGKATDQIVNENDEEDEVSPSGCRGSRVSVDDVMNFIGFGPFQVMAFFLASIGSFSNSIDFAFIVKPVEEEWNLSPLQFTILPSLTGVANIIGGFFLRLFVGHMVVSGHLHCVLITLVSAL